MSIKGPNTIMEKKILREAFRTGRDFLFSFSRIWHGAYLFSNNCVLIFGNLYCEFPNYDTKFVPSTRLYVILFKMDVS